MLASNSLSRNVQIVVLCARNCSSKVPAAAKAEPPPPGNFKKGKGVIGIEYLMPDFGSPAGKRPIKVELKAGETYAWCACGRSTKQPFCDGSHGKQGMPIVKPVRVQLDTTQSVLLCTCKQTLNRPYCDGSHKKLPTTRLDIPVDTVPSHYKGDVHEHVTKGVASELGLRMKDGYFY